MVIVSLVIVSSGHSSRHPPTTFCVGFVREIGKYLSFRPLFIKLCGCGIPTFELQVPPLFFFVIFSAHGIYNEFLYPLKELLHGCVCL